MSETGVLVRLLAAFGALALGGAAVAIVALLAHRTPGPARAASAPVSVGSPASTTPSVETPKTGFPAPPKGAVVFSRPFGHDVLALGVVPGRKLRLQASVLGGQGEGVEGMTISFRVGKAKVDAEPCGAGCYGATLASAGAPKAVDVTVAGSTPTTWHVALPKAWPPADASSIVARATKAFRSVRTLAIRDWLASGPGKPLYTRWTIQAPDRLTYQVQDGPAAVIIGNHRWDRLPGKQWEKSVQEPIHQPTPFWVSWTDAHVLASTRTEWRVSFFDPKTPGWYELRIAKGSLLTIEARMHATAHFMREVYEGFNSPIKIKPPR